MNVSCVAVSAVTIFAGSWLAIFPFVNWNHLCQWFNDLVGCRVIKCKNKKKCITLETSRYKSRLTKKKWNTQLSAYFPLPGRLTLDNEASSIPSIPSIWPTPLLSRLTVKAAYSFTATSSHELHTSMVYKVTDLGGKIKTWQDIIL